MIIVHNSYVGSMKIITNIIQGQMNQHSKCRNIVSIWEYIDLNQHHNNTSKFPLSYYIFLSNKRAPTIVDYMDVNL